MADRNTTVGGAIISLIAVLLIGGGILGIKSCASQSGTLSRWTGSSVKLPVPDDCVQVISLGKTATTKYLTYRNTQGQIVMREYSDWGVLEASYILDGATFDANLVRNQPQAQPEAAGGK